MYNKIIKNVTSVWIFTAQIFTNISDKHDSQFGQTAIFGNALLPAKKDTFGSTGHAVAIEGVGENELFIPGFFA